MIDTDFVKNFLKKGKLIKLPSEMKKRIHVLAWLAEHIPDEVRYTEREFNELLNSFHTFNDPAVLRRELFEFSLINRTPDGAVYMLNPDRPSPEELLTKYCGETIEKPVVVFAHNGPGESETTVELSERDFEAASDFRDRIHAEALRIVQRSFPDIESVVDSYSVEDYFQQIWDYPGRWYTVVAIPENAGSREDLVDAIVMNTIASYRTKKGMKQKYPDSIS